MPKSCSAYNCTNRYSKHTDITFHRFPFSKPTVFRQWLDNICRDDFYPKKHMVICSLHFTTDCFSGLGNRKNLLWNAVPTLFTFPPPNSKKRKSGKRLKMLPKCVTVSQEKMETQNDLDPEERLLSKSAEGNKKATQNGPTIDSGGPWTVNIRTAFAKKTRARPPPAGWTEPLLSSPADEH
ncbi:THAP domain-containing protein 3 isoform X4 [Salmo salar]|uniref:THAP domain-containing protein 3 isoform X4 n=1 Tax=Salmo salar TaxID=8030 RepID=A0A1S3LLW3_SALSA|nr:THAP domain-containing protein 3-like isoform X4 [Salmo salar]|eukprot:XP_013991835.1 PREDICTED: THAP domain-containing protein 3-like isoform X5 [Salmo salar]